MFPNPCLDQCSWQNGFFPLQDEDTPILKVDRGSYGPAPNRPLLKDLIREATESNTTAYNAIFLSYTHLKRWPTGVNKSLDTIKTSTKYSEKVKNFIYFCAQSVFFYAKELIGYIYFTKLTCNSARKLMKCTNSTAAKSGHFRHSNLGTELLSNDFRNVHYKATTAEHSLPVKSTNRNSF